MFNTEIPTEENNKKATENLIRIACEPFDNPGLRNTIINIKKRNEQTIDEITTDTLISAGYDSNAKEKSMKVIHTFKKFIDDNKDEPLVEANSIHLVVINIRCDIDSCGRLF